jgi:hypothetical protein
MLNGVPNWRGWRSRGRAGNRSGRPPHPGALSVGIKSAGKGFARARDRAAFCPRDRPSASAETGDSAPACVHPEIPLPGARAQTFRLEPVSVSSRTSLCRSRQFLPGKGLARTETGPRFLPTMDYFARQRRGSVAFPSPKPREVKDISGCARKPDLRRTAWWGWQDSNRRPNGYEPQSNHPRPSPHHCSEYWRRECGPIDMAPPAQAPSRWHRAGRSRQ